jgi:hypothetical protein
MIIKIIPENDAEKAKIQEVEHTGIREFFIFGNKKDADGELIDFHDWSGSYRYLVGSLYYFTNMLADEQASKAQNKPMEINLQQAPGDSVPGEAQVIPMEFPKEAQGYQGEGLVKKSGAQDGKIDGVVEIQDAKDSKGKADLKIVPAEGEMEVEEGEENDNSKSAED